MNYEMLGGGLGGPVNLNQIVAIAYSLCNYIWPLYEKSIEQLIMYHLQPNSLRNPKKFRTFEPFKFLNARFFYPYKQWKNF